MMEDYLISLIIPSLIHYLVNLMYHQILCNMICLTLGEICFYKNFWGGLNQEYEYGEKILFAIMVQNNVETLSNS